MTDNLSNRQIDKQDDFFPKEVKLAIKGLASEDAFAVVATLLRNGGSLEPDELADRLDTNVNTIHKIADELERGAVIEKEAGEIIGDKSVGPYRMTTYGENIIDALYEASTPN